MDWSTFQPLFISLAGAAITFGVPAGVLIFRQYTGIQISAANEESIRAAAMTEAGKLLTLGTPVTALNASEGAAKVLKDLAPQNATENYTHADVTDMIVAAASTAPEAIVKMVTGKK